MHDILRKKRPLRVVIVGGSCAGLFTGILLKRQGHHVRILELATSSKREGQAAGIGLATHVKRFFDEHDRLKDIPFGTTSYYMATVDEKLLAPQKVVVDRRMTTWDALYYRLRANFDAFASHHCTEPPPLDPSEGEGVLEFGVRVLRIEQGSNGLTVVAESTVTREAQVYEADVVVGADGGNSVARKQVLPELQRNESGYLVWRGIVPVKNIPRDVLDAIADNITIYPVPNTKSYMVMFTIPGPNGALTPDAQALNFVWYDWPNHHSTAAILTDRSGHQHGTTLPKGEMDSEIWTAQVERAHRYMDPRMANIFAQTEDPFVARVSSSVAPKASFFNDRLFLVGDALTQVQPNLGQGASMAALGAMLLADVIAGKATVEEFERETIKTARRENATAIKFATVHMGEGPGDAGTTVGGS